MFKKSVQSFLMSNDCYFPVTEVSEGVAGTLSLIQNVTMSSQPINGFDWNVDKLGLCVHGV